MTSARARRTGVLLLPFAVYLIGVVLLGDWIIDDAGISYAYARNLASGHGFVSQPGRPPVEGFSNFLWVAALVPFFWLHVFEPVFLVKALGAACVLGALWLVQRTSRAHHGSDGPGLLAGLLIAAAPPVVIWSASGLENGLTLLLVAALFATAGGGVHIGGAAPSSAGVHMGRWAYPARGWQMRCGVLAGLLAMTHPDGAIYALLGVVLAAARFVRWALPARFSAEGGLPRVSSQPALGAHARVATGPGVTPRALAAERERRAGAARKGEANPTLRNPEEVASIGSELLAHVGGFALVFGPFLLLRLGVFGLPLPHTYYAKRIHATFEARLADIVAHPEALLAKLLELCRGAAGPAGPMVVGLTLAGAIFLAARRKMPRHVGIALALQGLAFAGYLWIDEDWMGEHRFGVAAVFLALLSAVLVATTITKELPARSQRWLTVAAGAFTLSAFALFLPRIVTFAANPPTPYLDVQRSFARKLDAYADGLGIAQGSVLLPDVGATLFTSRLTVYDAAGLCEPDVVRTLKKGTPVWLAEHPDFYDWVFDEVRPTFISTHHFWTYVTAFDRDPRFARDYVAIDAYEDAYVLRTYGRSLRSGDFVRRDALADFDALERVRASYRAPPRPDPLVLRLADALVGLDSEPQTALALRNAARRALQEDRDPNRAASLLGKLLARSPSDIDAALERAWALDAAARPDEARLEWARVLSLASSSPSRSARGVTARERLAGLPQRIDLSP